jgi:hypothetical protein
MLENISKVAEAVATDVSRRAFLGRFGRGTLACAATVAGLLALPSLAHASPRTARCCLRYGFCRRPGGHCYLVNNCHPGIGKYYCDWNCNGTIILSACA